jgi:lipopolysaccharide/colanic/teichoic acid biosynthesis glycosyltransferase
VIERALRAGNAPAVLAYGGRTFVYSVPRRRNPRAKRVVDIALSIPLGALALPVLLFAALGVKLTSRGPILFSQQRASSRVVRSGDGQAVVEVYPFRCLKLRTMVAHADERVHRDHVHSYIRGEAVATDAHGFKVRDDDRITPFGRVLRKTSIDELPQLFNVLRGEMSLVGPRPVPLYELESYPRGALERLLVKPGITGLWQVEGRSRASFDEMVELDVRYAREASFGTDLVLLARTIPSVLRRRGAA